jgi:hypothetical protein
MKADKGEALVLTTAQDYSKRVHEFFTKAGAKPIRFRIHSYSDELCKLVKKSTSLINIPRQNLKVMNYSSPKFYGQMKTHRLDRPI